MELRGITAIITGSSGRLGSAIAQSLAEAGCDCVCHYNRNREKAEHLVGQIESFGARGLAIEADLTEAEGIDSFFEEAGSLGLPRVLINSAAVFSRQPLEGVTFEEAQRVLNLNLIAPILVSRAFARMIDAEFPEADSVVGKIINIADIGGVRPWAEYSVYCSSKAGLIGTTKALAKELAPRICVNCVAPGVVGWPSDFDESEKQRQLSFIPVKRIAEVNEITDAIIFLLKNDYITGEILCVDGGRGI